MFDDLSSWYYSSTPTWMGGTKGLPQEGPTASGATLDQSLGQTGTNASSSDLGSALQALSKSSLAKQPEVTPLAAAKITEVAAGRPRQAASLDALAQLLEKQRAQYSGQTGQPVTRQQMLGLLGF
jgi:hypothetical protein